MKRSLDNDPQDVSALSLQNIVDILRHGPIRTRDLIYKLRDKLKDSVKNRELLKTILKEVSIVRPSINDNPEPIIVLKPDFIQND